MSHKMKLSLVFTIGFILSTPAFADEETLLRSGSIESGGFGGPLVRFTPINGEFGVLVGARGGWLINHSYAIGIAGYGLASKVNADVPDTSRLEFGAGGFFIEAVFLPERLVHGTASLLIGAGGINLWQGDEKQNDPVFVLEPEVNLEVNIIQWLRFCPGISYRYVGGESKPVNSSWDLSGVSGNLTFKFGKF